MKDLELWMVLCVSCYHGGEKFGFSSQTVQSFLFGFAFLFRRGGLISGLFLC